MYPYLKSLAGRVFGTSVLLAALTVNASAAAPGAIYGTVQDVLGRAIPGAKVSLQKESGDVVGSIHSDRSGKFVFKSVAPGTYAITVDKEGYQEGVSIVSLDGEPSVSSLVTLSADQALELKIEEEKLDQARNSLTTRTGGSVYRFDETDIENLPQGMSTPLNQILLQAPGVVQDSFGQVHVRGEHANMQYRIDGTILPEGVSGFGQSFDARFINNVNFLTGALPAQYGNRTAGVVEITTKTQTENGGFVDIYGGSNNTFNPSFQLGGSSGKFSYFITGSYLTSNQGIENPTDSMHAIHDRTEQTNGFASLSYLVSPTTKISALLGSYEDSFQIPNVPGQIPDPNGLGFLAGTGLTSVNSANLNSTQKESNQYAILALQSTIGSDFDYQASVFTHYTNVHYYPDLLPELAFNGVASNIYRSSISNGIQIDTAYRAFADHTIRVGLLASNENVTANSANTVFPVDANGSVNGPYFTINDSSGQNGNRQAAIYAQDEWKITDRLTVNYGLRFDQLNAYVQESQVSPRLGLTFKATPDTTLFAGYASYFTPPPTELVSSNTINLFANTSNAVEVTQNDPVKAERSQYFDIGVNQQISKGFNVGLEGFYKKITNMLDEGQFGQALIYAPFNYDQGLIYGAQLTVTYRTDNVNSYFNLARTTSMGKGINSAQYNFSQAELDYIANNWVHTDHDQAWTASGGVSFTWQGVRWSLDGIYGSGMRAGFANEDVMPAYLQLNAGASWKMDTAVTGPFDMRVAVINLLNRSYELRDGSGIGVGAPQYGPRIGAFVGVTKSF